MSKLVEEFEREGFVVLPGAITKESLLKISDSCEKLGLEGAGNRNMLSYSWVAKLSNTLKKDLRLSALLPSKAKSVQCIYFNKSESSNWLVAPHRDTTIHVQNRFESKGWSAWSQKQGGHFVRPPKSVLSSLVAVRLHLENCTINNGALCVVPRSHREQESSSQQTTICEAMAGSALVMRPTLIHSSSKLKSGRRRVLHFVFGPEKLPSPARWAYAV